MQRIAREAREAAGAETVRGVGRVLGARAGPGPAPSVVAAYQDTVQELLRTEPGTKSLLRLRQWCAVERRCFFQRVRSPPGNCRSSR